MRIRIGYEMVYDCPQPTPMILTLNVHYTRTSDLEEPDRLATSPSLPMSAYRDGFGNWCSRIVAPKGLTKITGMTIIRDSGLPDPVAPGFATPPTVVRSGSVPFWPFIREPSGFPSG